MSGGLRFTIRAKDKTRQTFNAIRGRLKGLQRQMSRLSKSFRGFGSLVAAVFAGFSVSAIVRTTDQLGKMSQRLGLTTQALSELKFAGEQTGVEFDTLSMGLQRMTRRIAEAANGTGEARAALQELGLSATQLNQLSPDQQFRLIAEAMQQVELQSDKVRLAMKLFDSEGVALIQTMQGGAEAVDALSERLRRLGGVINGEQASAMARLNDAWNELTTAVEGLGREIMTVLEPALTLIIKGFRELFILLRRLLKTVLLLDDLFTSLFANIGNALGAFDDETAQKFSKRLSDQWKEIWYNTEGAKQAVDKYNGALGNTPTFPGIGAPSNDNRLPNGTDITIRGGLSDWDKSVNRTIENIEERFKEGAFNIITDFDNIGDNIKGTLKDIGNMLLRNQFDQIFQSFSSSQMGGDMLGSFRRGLGDLLGYDGIMNGTGAPPSNIFGSVGDFFGGAFNGISSMFSGFGGFFADGGMFSAGKPIVVGERGPELIMPQRSGTVIPNEALSQPASTNVTLNITTPDIHGFRASQSQITTEMANAMAVAQRRHG